MYLLGVTTTDTRLYPVHLDSQIDTMKMVEHNEHHFLVKFYVSIRYAPKDFNIFLNPNELVVFNSAVVYV